MPAIAVFGSLNMDFVVRVEKLPAAGQTVSGAAFRQIPGGKGANQAFACARLGAGIPVRMIGRVGYDAFADQLKAGLAAAGVDVSYVHAARNYPTGIAMIQVDRAGQNTIVIAPGANAELSATDVEGLRPAFKDAAFALFQLETPLTAVRAAMRVAHEEGARTMLDPAPAQKLPPEVLAGVDILTPNETEALALLGHEPARLRPQDAELIAQQLRAMGPRTVIVKMGDRGCFYLADGKSLHVPARVVKAVDATAAGDTFNAALAVAITEGETIAEALRFANAAAAISVTRVGAQSSIPTRAEVDAQS
jgi:ribokinase